VTRTRNPTHFETISSRRLFEHDGAEGASRDNAELIALTERTLAAAFAAGQLARVTSSRSRSPAARWSTALPG
jgi:hypothetical protein